jgi:hypothetical protein
MAVEPVQPERSHETDENQTTPGDFIGVPAMCRTHERADR